MKESLADLQARLQRQYDLQHYSVSIHGRAVQACSVADLEALFEELLTKSDDHPDIRDERIPYWAELWPASIGLAEYLMEQPPLAPGTQVLELGCGLGLSGLAAHWRGGIVTLSDYLPEALDMARYLWGLNQAEPHSTTLLDWRAPDPALVTDLLIAADVAYEVRALEPLLRSFRRLKRPNGRVLISEPSRKVGQEWMQQLQQEGLARQVALKPVVMDKITFPVGIYEVLV